MSNIGNHEKFPLVKTLLTKFYMTEKLNIVLKWLKQNLINLINMTEEDHEILRILLNAGFVNNNIEKVKWK